jgi:TPP-dependent pyruvate/acetoin dehydrogenase alpha subunit
LKERRHALACGARDIHALEIFLRWRGHKHHSRKRRTIKTMIMTMISPFGQLGTITREAVGVSFTHKSTREGTLTTNIAIGCKYFNDIG